MTDCKGEKAKNIVAKLGTVVLEAPLTASHPEELPRSPSRVAALVLVVDDQTDLRTYTSRVLQTNGYAVIEAADGLQAIAALCEYAPDLVVLDLNMPIMDGWQFRAEQQRLPDGQLAATPVVLVTGVGDVDHHAAQLQAAGVVTKPFNPAQLLGAVQQALRC